MAGPGSRGRLHRARRLLPGALVLALAGGRVDRVAGGRLPPALAGALSLVTLPRPGLAPALPQLLLDVGAGLPPGNPRVDRLPDPGPAGRATCGPGRLGTRRGGPVPGD